MNRVNAEVRISETAIVKRENRLLWVLVALLFCLSLYQDWQIEKVKSSITPQSVIDACFFVNKGAK